MKIPVHAAAYKVAVTPEQLASARALAEERYLSDELLDSLAMGIALARWGGKSVPSIFDDINPIGVGKPIHTEEARAPLRNLLLESGLTLADLYQSRDLDCLEFYQHVDAISILEMFDQLSGALPRPQLEELEDALFVPLRNLKQKAEVVGAGLERLMRDGALRERLQHPKVKLGAPIDMKELAGHSLSGIDRYAIGDPIRVRRHGDRFEVGEVIGLEGDALMVAVLGHDNENSSKRITASLLERDSMLKLGDWFPNYEGGLRPGGPCGWNIGVVGLNIDGSLCVQAAPVGSNDWSILSDGEVQYVAWSLTAQLGLHSPARTDPVPGATPVIDGEQIIEHAGNVAMTRVEGFEGRHVEGACFTDEGIEYEPYNEDSVLVGRFVGDERRKEVGVSITSDQAGGACKLLGTDGAIIEGGASRVVVDHLRKAAEMIWRATDSGGPALDPTQGRDPRKTFAAALTRAQDELRVMTAQTVDNPSCATASVVAIIDGVAYGANVGDSMVLHFSADGRLKNHTTPDNIEYSALQLPKADPNAYLGSAHIVTRMIGEHHPLRLDEDEDTFEWKLEPGDYLVTATDGLLDANLYAQSRAVKVYDDRWNRNHANVTLDHIGAMVRRSSGAEDLTQLLVDYTTRQMTPDDVVAYREAKQRYQASRSKSDADAIYMAAGSGKPDNRGFGVLRYLG